jgi:hypothetical protein
MDDGTVSVGAELYEEDCFLPRLRFKEEGAEPRMD